MPDPKQPRVPILERLDFLRSCTLTDAEGREAVQLILGRVRSSNVEEIKVSGELWPARVLITDARVAVMGHAPDKAVCVAISTAIQCACRIAGDLQLLAAPPIMDLDAPHYEFELVAGDRAQESAAVINGFAMTMHGIGQTRPGTLVVSDGRKRDAEPARRLTVAR